MAAKFKTEAGFKITGRGFVIAGDITKGTISAGNRICTHELEPLNGKLIKSVEFITSISTRMAKIGLMLPCQTEAELQELKGLDLQDKIIEIKE